MKRVVWLFAFVIYEFCLSLKFLLCLFLVSNKNNTRIGHANLDWNRPRPQATLIPHTIFLYRAQISMLSDIFKNNLYMPVDKNKRNLSCYLGWVDRENPKGRYAVKCGMAFIDFGNSSSSHFSPSRNMSRVIMQSVERYDQLLKSYLDKCIFRIYVHYFWTIFFYVHRWTINNNL